MIGFLKGVLVDKKPPRVVLEVGGVGYEIDAPMSTFYRLPQLGEPVMLITHLIVREDAHALYGFASEEERALFRNLIKVSGVGARIALAVLSGMSVQGFAHCILHKELASLTRIPGVGRKTAERLLVEMADRVPDTPAAGLARSASSLSAQGEAQDALIALGYKPTEVARLLQDLDTARLSTEELIREALRRVHVG